MKIITRGKGKSAVAAAAYRAGEKITNEYTGLIHDYTKKGGIAHRSILLPENAPAEYSDRAVLWNAVERVEKAVNSQLARDIEISLPVELTKEQNINLVREYVKSQFVDNGMVADICFHDMETHNPHAHILLTMRPFDEDRTWGTKQKKEYILNPQGEKIYDPKKRQYKCKSIPTTDWSDKGKADTWREAWADVQNRHLEKHGFDVRVDHRSYEKQGIEQIPTIHLGTASHQMEQRGIRTERGDINRAIQKANEEIKNINAAILKLENELEQIKIEQQQEQAQQKQDIPTTAQKTSKADSVKKPTAQTAQTKTKPVQKPKTETQSNPVQKRKTLKQVDKEIEIVETKLQRLDFADQVLMSFGHKIQDIQRNLSSAGFFERRKMLKEIATEEQRRDEYKAEAVKKYGDKSQLIDQKHRLLKEKKQIEDATGVTAAREREQQRKWHEARQQQQERDRYNAERKAQRLANPSKKKDEPSLG